MILHEHPDVFGTLIEESRSMFDVPAAYIEKDYWVTRSLMLLSISDVADKIVFKGGTSLSKAHKIITRFSEDIDLAVLNIDQSGNQIKKLLKKTEDTMTVELSYNKNHAQESKGSAFRKTVYDYPKLNDTGNIGPVMDSILIEVNSFTKPEPFSVIEINSYIGDYLQEKGENDLIKKYALASFFVNTLDVERTLIEKIMGLVKISYHNDYENSLTNKIRHVYDIVMILRKEKYATFLSSLDVIQMITSVVESEQDLPGKMKTDWLSNPLSAAKIFSQSDAIVPMLAQVIQGDFKQMVFHTNVPDAKEITGALNNVRSVLSQYDNKT